MSFKNSGVFMKFNIFLIILQYGLTFSAANSNVCRPEDSNRKDGVIVFKPYATNTNFETCTWIFQPPSDEFMLVIRFLDVQNYDLDDSIRLPDGSYFEGKVPQNGEVCYKFIREPESREGNCITNLVLHTQCSSSETKYLKPDAFPVTLTIETSLKSENVGLTQMEFQYSMLECPKIFSRQAAQASAGTISNEQYKPTVKVAVTTTDSRAVLGVLVTFFILCLIVIGVLVVKLLTETEKDKRNKQITDVFDSARSPNQTMTPSSGEELSGSGQHTTKVTFEDDPSGFSNETGPSKGSRSPGESLSDRGERQSRSGRRRSSSQSGRRHSHSTRRSSREGEGGHSRRSHSGRKSSFGFLFGNKNDDYTSGWDKGKNFFGRDRSSSKSGRRRSDSHHHSERRSSRHEGRGEDHPDSVKTNGDSNKNRSEHGRRGSLSNKRQSNLRGRRSSNSYRSKSGTFQDVDASDFGRSRSTYQHSISDSEVASHRTRSKRRCRSGELTDSELLSRNPRSSTITHTICRSCERCHLCSGEFDEETIIESEWSSYTSGDEICSDPNCPLNEKTHVIRKVRRTSKQSGNRSYRSECSNVREIKSRGSSYATATNECEETNRCVFQKNSSCPFDRTQGSRSVCSPGDSTVYVTRNRDFDEDASSCSFARRTRSVSRRSPMSDTFSEPTSFATGVECAPCPLQLQEECEKFQAVGTAVLCVTMFFMLSFMQALKRLECIRYGTPCEQKAIRKINCPIPKAILGARRSGSRMRVTKRKKSRGRSSSRSSSSSRLRSYSLECPLKPRLVCEIGSPPADCNQENRKVCSFGQTRPSRTCLIPVIERPKQCPQTLVEKHKQCPFLPIEPPCYFADNSLSCALERRKKCPITLVERQRVCPATLVEKQRNCPFEAYEIDRSESSNPDEVTCPFSKRERPKKRSCTSIKKSMSCPYTKTEKSNSCIFTVHEKPIPCRFAEAVKPKTCPFAFPQPLKSDSYIVVENSQTCPFSPPVKRKPCPYSPTSKSRSRIYDVETHKPCPYTKVEKYEVSPSTTIEKRTHCPNTIQEKSKVVFAGDSSSPAIVVHEGSSCPVNEANKKPCPVTIVERDNPRSKIVVQKKYKCPLEVACNQSRSPERSKISVVEQRKEYPYEDYSDRRCSPTLVVETKNSSPVICKKERQASPECYRKNARSPITIIEKKKSCPVTVVERRQPPCPYEPSSVTVIEKHPSRRSRTSSPSLTIKRNCQSPVTIIKEKKSSSPCFLENYDISEDDFDESSISIVEKQTPCGVNIIETKTRSPCRELRKMSSPTMVCKQRTSPIMMSERTSPKIVYEKRKSSPTIVCKRSSPQIFYKKRHSPTIVCKRRRSSPKIICKRSSPTLIFERRKSSLKSNSEKQKSSPTTLCRKERKSPLFILPEQSSTSICSKEPRSPKILIKEKRSSQADLKKKSRSTNMVYKNEEGLPTYIIRKSTRENDCEKCRKSPTFIIEKRSTKSSTKSDKQPSTIIVRQKSPPCMNKQSSSKECEKKSKTRTIIVEKKSPEGAKEKQPTRTIVVEKRTCNSGSDKVKFATAQEAMDKPCKAQQLNANLCKAHKAPVQNSFPCIKCIAEETKRQLLADKEASRLLSSATEMTTTSDSGPKPFERHMKFNIEARRTHSKPGRAPTVQNISGAGIPLNNNAPLANQVADHLGSALVNGLPEECASQSTQMCTNAAMMGIEPCAEAARRGMPPCFDQPISPCQAYGQQNGMGNFVGNSYDSSEIPTEVFQNKKLSFSTEPQSFDPKTSDSIYEGSPRKSSVDAGGSRDSISRKGRRDSVSRKSSKDNGSRRDSKTYGARKDSKDDTPRKDSKDESSRKDSKDEGSRKDSKDDDKVAETSPGTTSSSTDSTSKQPKKEDEDKDAALISTIISDVPGPAPADAFRKPSQPESPPKFRRGKKSIEGESPTLNIKIEESTINKYGNDQQEQLHTITQGTAGIKSSNIPTDEMVKGLINLEGKMSPKNSLISVLVDTHTKKHTLSSSSPRFGRNSCQLLQTNTYQQPICKNQYLAPPPNCQRLTAQRNLEQPIAQQTAQVLSPGPDGSITQKSIHSQVLPTGTVGSVTERTVQSQVLPNGTERSITQQSVHSQLFPPCAENQAAQQPVCGMSPDAIAANRNAQICQAPGFPNVQEQPFCAMNQMMNARPPCLNARIMTAENQCRQFSGFDPRFGPCGAEPHRGFPFGYGYEQHPVAYPGMPPLPYQPQPTQPQPTQPQQIQPQQIQPQQVQQQFAAPPKHSMVGDESCLPASGYRPMKSILKEHRDRTKHSLDYLMDIVEQGRGRTLKHRTNVQEDYPPRIRHDKHLTDPSKKPVSSTSSDWSQYNLMMKQRTPKQETSNFVEIIDTPPRHSTVKKDTEMFRNKPAMYEGPGLTTTPGDLRPIEDLAFHTRTSINTSRDRLDGYEEAVLAGKVEREEDSRGGFETPDKTSKKSILSTRRSQASVRSRKKGRPTSGPRDGPPGESPRGPSRGPSGAPPGGSPRGPSRGPSGGPPGGSPRGPSRGPPGGPPEPVESFQSKDEGRSGGKKKKRKKEKDLEAKASKSPSSRNEAGLKQGSSSSKGKSSQKPKRVKKRKP